MLPLFTLVLILVLLGMVGMALWYVKRVYLDIQPSLDDLLRELRPNLLEPPPVLRTLVLRYSEDAYARLVCRRLIEHLSGDTDLQSDMQIRLLVWSYLLPRRLGQELMLMLYAHFMIFEGGTGLAHGAHAYYAKSPSELDDQEVLGLYVIASAPDRYSPNVDPKAFEAQCRRYRLG